jgi:phosphatidate cytidylyltransferase
MVNAMADTGTARWQQLRSRIFTTFVLVLLTLPEIILGGYLFFALILLLGGYGYYEWLKLVHPLQFYWKLLGIFLLILPMLSLLWLRISDNIEHNLILTLCIIGYTISTDVGAYFSGKLIGGPKAFPTISPNKTWAGVFGGMLTAILFGMAMESNGYIDAAYPLLFISIFISLSAQAGDLFESWLKRKVNIKDSGSLLAAHGGLLDRLDSIIFATPAFAGLVYVGIIYS